MPRIVNLLAIALIVSVPLSGCSSLTAEGRREAAVRHRIAKVRKQKMKQLAKANKEANRPLRDPITVSEPKMSFSVEQVPDEAASSETTQSYAAPPVTPDAAQQPTP